MSEQTFPTLVRGHDETVPNTLSEFYQLRYDGWALKDPDAEINGAIPTPAPSSGDVLPNPAPPTPPAPGADGGNSGDGPPPMGGAGSGVEAWRTYARSLTNPAVDIDGLDTREQIVDAINAAGHPTERTD